MLTTATTLNRTGIPLQYSLFRRVFLISAITASLVCHSGLSSAQQVILNTRGERIVVYPDGSWRYYEASDSILMNKHLRKEDIPSPEENTHAIEQSVVNPVSDADISSLAIRFAHRMRGEAESAHQQLTQSVSDKFAIEGRLEQAQENLQLIEADLIASLEDEYEFLRIAVKKHQKHLKKMEKLSAKAQDILTLPVQRKPKALNKLIAQYEAYVVRENIQLAEQLPVVSPEDRYRVKETVEAPRKTAAIPNKTQKDKSAAAVADVQVYHRKPVPCRLQRPADEGSPRNGMAVEKGLLFTHTDEDLRPYFRQEELVSCYASLRQIENNVYLSLEFVIASSDARKNFGLLEIKSLLRLKLLDGTFISLFNARSDHGRIDPYTGDTVYMGYYLLDRESAKALSSHELDKVRVVWSSGFEDYDIVDVDFLVNQFACLESAVN